MFCVLCDVHSNLEALEAVLAAAGSAGAERFLFVGDAVGYGPDPNACAGRIRSITDAAVAGNHDRAAVGRLDISWFNQHARQAIEWTTSQLEPGLRAYLESLPDKTTHESVLLAHGSPRDPIEEYILDARAAEDNFRVEDFDICFVGHSHMPLVFEINQDSEVTMAEPVAGTLLKLKSGHRYIINVGSVGQPRDLNPEAAFGIFDMDEGAISFRRVPYAYELTQEKMRKNGLPVHLVDRLGIGE